MVETRGVFIKEAGEENADLGREFLESPEAFAKANGLDPEKLECPPEAHAALDRANALGLDVMAAGIKPDSASMGKLREIVSQHFGSDFEVSLVPFGLKFREKLGTQAIDITATGSGTITWLDTDADVDS